MKPTFHGDRSLAVPVLLPDVEPRLQQLQTVIKRHQFQPSALLEILHAAQKIFGCLSSETLAFVAHNLRLPPSKVYGVATFYHMFRHQPPTSHTCTVCLGTACFMHGGDKLLVAFQTQRAIQAGATRPEPPLTFHVARCLGMCGIAPVVVYDGEPVGHQTPDMLTARLKGWAGT